MNDRIHLLLDGDLPDDEAATFLRTLADSSEARARFRNHMKLHGALFRNEVHAPMSAAEESEMLSRVSNAIDAPATSSIRRIGSLTWGFVTTALIMGLCGGYFGYAGFNSSNVPPSATNVMIPAVAVPTVLPCNCDSIAMAAAGRVRDSVAIASKSTNGTSVHRVSSYARHRYVDNDPTGSKKAAALGKRKHGQAPL